MSDQPFSPPKPTELLQTLIRFDTTNPPGNEAECVTYLNELLQAAGIETTIQARDPRRLNLIARLPGQGNAPPLMMYGHVDVVTTLDQNWLYPPFSGEIAEGCIWGRGALDMKGGIAMMVSAMLRAKVEGVPLPGDVILAVLSDEEVDGEYGASYLVDQHAELFKGIRYAIGEGGGFSVYLAGHKLYPIMVCEKQVCSVQVIVRGPGGHGSVPLRNGAMSKLARLIQKLERYHLPVHITPVARQMIETMARALPFPARQGLRLLLNPALTDMILDSMGEQGRLLNPALHNTVSATIVRGGHKINVIPSEISLELDGRLLPGFKPDDMLCELRQLLGDDVELEVTRYDPGPGEPDMGLYDRLADTLRECDPAAIPMPYLLSGVTDGRYFAKLGIQTYGFLPVSLPAGVDLLSTIHSANERIPLSGVEFGTDVLYKVLQGFGT
jgi:acetylornithine deacetylase/succinyl-diaminopimelate desuccinylase-like protein